jgi:OmpA-OmpF porin, OOP family
MFKKIAGAAAPGINGDIDLNQASLSAVGTFPLSNGFSLLGRLGYSYVEAENKVVGGRVKTSDSNGIVGVGLGYAFTPAISARLEFQKPSSDSQNVSIGLAYQF